MPLRLPLPIVIAILFAGCGAPPTLVMPSGHTRSSVNSPGAIAEYAAAAERDIAKLRADEQAEKQVQLMKADIAELKALMTEYTYHEEATLKAAGALPLKVPVVSAVKAVEAPLDSRLSKPTSRVTETIRADDQVVLFRTTFDNDDSRFAPSLMFRRALLKAAQTGQAISIRGATDSANRTLGSERIAKERAENVRKYLVANGIDPAKLKSSFVAAGGFIADNSTSDGRSKNRRVEIEVLKQGKSKNTSNGHPTAGAAK
jgi:outer membrane protein OmpA-like peptidoglycan-associated protein